MIKCGLPHTHTSTGASGGTMPRNSRQGAAVRFPEVPSRAGRRGKHVTLKNKQFLIDNSGGAQDKTFPNTCGRK